MTPRAAPPIAWLLAIAACGGAAGCRRSDATEPAPAPSEPPAVAAAPAPAPALDRLAPDELVEGDQKAFGVVLPRDLHVDGAFHDSVLASGKVGVHPLVTYFRARIKDGSVHEGEETATFDHCHIPGNSSSEYTLHVWRIGAYCRIDLRDVTQKAPADVPDSVRWRQAGLTPQGKLLDPAHLD